MSAITSGALLCAALLLLSALQGDAMPHPFFGLDFFNPSVLANGTSVFADLAASHAAHSLSALAQLAQFAQLAHNVSDSFLQG